jgi:hypothetical protein
MKKSKFPKRVVLAEGYPWALGGNPYDGIQIHDNLTEGRPVSMAFPDDLWSAFEPYPRYRLVLERIPESRDA